MEMMDGNTNIFLGRIILVKVEFDLEIVSKVLLRTGLEQSITLAGIIASNSFKSLQAVGR